MNRIFLLLFINLHFIKYKNKVSLPSSNILPINKLASVFKSKVATYKFYWLIAFVELVEEGYTEIPKRKIFSRMISNSWYTINYFHISFGKQDKMQIAVESILNKEDLTIDSKKNDINYCLENTLNKETRNELFHLDKNVPHWFLSPWFPQTSKTEIYKLSANLEDDCLYALYKDKIVVNPLWIDYIKINSKILKDYCYWNLALFLQTRNPNVPDIPNKLIKPATRNSLTQQTNNYWKIVFQELNVFSVELNCILMKRILLLIISSHMPLYRMI